jgi:hypothetical protein
MEQMMGVLAGLDGFLSVRNEGPSRKDRGRTRELYWAPCTEVMHLLTTLQDQACSTWSPQRSDMRRQGNWGLIWGPALSPRMLKSTEKTDPRWWWDPAGGCNFHRAVNPLCIFCITWGPHSQGPRQGIQQWGKTLWHKIAVTFGKWENGLQGPQASRQAAGPCS